MQQKEIGKKKFLGNGKFNKCYTLENGNVYKEFGKPLNLVEIDRFKYLLEYKNSSMAFPFDFVYDNKMFYGYITEKAPGIVMEKAFEKSNILDMSTNSIRVEKDIKFISNGLIMMYDFHDNNFMYDGKKFTIIDFDEYAKVSVYSKDEIIKRNIKTYKGLFCGLFNGILKPNRNTSYVVNKIQKYYHLDISASEMLYQIKEDMDKYYKTDINKPEDIKQIISR